MLSYGLKFSSPRLDQDSYHDSRCSKNSHFDIFSWSILPLLFLNVEFAIVSGHYIGKLFWVRHEQRLGFYFLLPFFCYLPFIAN